MLRAWKQKPRGLPHTQKGGTRPLADAMRTLRATTHVQDITHTLRALVQKLLAKNHMLRVLIRKPYR